MQLDANTDAERTLQQMPGCAPSRNESIDATASNVTYDPKIVAA
jgi:hypothetical protein